MSHQELIDRLRGVEERLADEMLDALRSAGHASEPDEKAASLALERRLGRARRAVEKAIRELSGGDED